MGVLRPEQFGAEQARGMASPPREEVSGEERMLGPAQRQLFPTTGTDYMLEPHQQTRAEFANDPRTWWHGRYGEQLPRTGGGKNAGVHVGTFGSSDKRRRDLGPSHKFKGTYGEGPQPWRSFPVRLQGETVPNWQGPGSSPTNPGPDEGNKWTPKGGVHYYRNAVEDRGSISALAPSRANLLTHGQAVRAAGAKAHPLVRWEAEQLKGKEYDPSREDPAVSKHRAYHQAGGVVLQPRLFDPAFLPDPGPNVHDRRTEMVLEAQKSIARQKSAAELQRYRSGQR